MFLCLWFCNIAGWQKLCEGTKGLRQKVWIGTKILSSSIRYFVAIIRFIAIYALFGNLWAKKGFFGQKQCCLGKKVEGHRKTVTPTKLKRRSRTTAPAPARPHRSALRLK